MLNDYLARPEGKTLEFKENTKNLHGIVKTVIAFANTAGGVIVIGVRDRTKEILGVEDALQEEERLASAIADNVTPLLVPDIEIHSYDDKAVILLHLAENQKLRAVVVHRSKQVYLRPFPHKTPFKDMVC